MKMISWYSHKASLGETFKFKALENQAYIYIQMESNKAIGKSISMLDDSDSHSIN